MYSWLRRLFLSVSIRGNPCPSVFNWHTGCHRRIAASVAVVLTSISACAGMTKVLGVLAVQFFTFISSQPLLKALADGADDLDAGEILVVALDQHPRASLVLVRSTISFTAVS